MVKKFNIRGEVMKKINKFVLILIVTVMVGILVFLSYYILNNVFNKNENDVSYSASIDFSKTTAYTFETNRNGSPKFINAKVTFDSGYKSPQCSV